MTNIHKAAREAPGEEREGNDAFEAWWETHGQFCRAGGGDYEKSFAHSAWQARAMLAARPEAPTVALTDEQIDGLMRSIGLVLADDNDRRMANHAEWERRQRRKIARASIAKFCEVNGLAQPTEGKEGGA